MIMDQSEKLCNIDFLEITMFTKILNSIKKTTSAAASTGIEAIMSLSLCRFSCKKYCIQNMKTSSFTEKYMTNMQKQTVLKSKIYFSRCFMLKSVKKEHYICFIVKKICIAI